MIRIEKNTRLGREEILRRASEYFGENGVGLSETCRNRCTIAFEGAGGYLSATIIEKDAERLVEDAAELGGEDEGVVFAGADVSNWHAMTTMPTEEEEDQVNGRILVPTWEEEDHVFHCFHNHENGTFK